MALTIIKIVLILLMIRVIGLTIGHLVIVFWDYATDYAVKQIMENPEEYVRTEHICKFMYNMIWVVVFIQLLRATFSGHIILN